MKKLDKEINILKKLLVEEKQSKFSCYECKNQHNQILNWLKELKDYESGKIGKNCDNPSMKGYLSLNEAIEHTKEVINTSNDEIKTQHEQLLNWLEKLKQYRNK